MNSNSQEARDQSNEPLIENPNRINDIVFELVNNMKGLSENQRAFIMRKAIEQLKPKNKKRGAVLDWRCTEQDIINAVRLSAKLLQTKDDKSDPIALIRKPMKKASIDIAKIASEKSDEDLSAAG
jgi:hypothetical protein